MKRIDTHTHPKISKHFAFDPGRSSAWSDGAPGRAARARLTEHFHATSYWDTPFISKRPTLRSRCVLGRRHGADPRCRGQHPRGRPRDRAGGGAELRRLDARSRGACRSTTSRPCASSSTSPTTSTSRASAPTCSATPRSSGSFRRATCAGSTRSRSTARTSARRSCCSYRREPSVCPSSAAATPTLAADRRAPHAGAHRRPLGAQPHQDHQRRLDRLRDVPLHSAARQDF